MSHDDLPLGWNVTSGDDLFDFVRGVTFKKLDSSSEPFDGAVGILRAGNIQDGRIELDDVVYVDRSYVKDQQQLREGDLLIATSSGSPKIVGKAATVTTDLPNIAFGAFCAVLRPQDITIYPWLSQFFQTKEYRSLVSSKSRGMHIANLKRQDFVSLELPFPPLNEQRRIVSKIEQLQGHSDTAKTALDAIPALLEQFRQSVLAAAFRGDLTKTWRLQQQQAGNDIEPASVLLDRIRAERKARFIQTTAQTATEKAKTKALKANKPWTSEIHTKTLAKETTKATKKYKPPHPVDETDLPELPEGWCWASIGDAFHVGVGATPSRKQPNYWNGEIPWVSSGEVAFCRVNETREHITNEGLENSSTNMHPPGTVLLGMIGEGKTRGQAAILDIAACNNQNSAAIRVAEAGIPPEYMYYFLQGEYARTRRVGSGNNQQALNKTRVQQIRFPLPPLDEIQTAITQISIRFDSVDSLMEHANDAAGGIAPLNQSILAKAFRGELVDQDPSDEPATTLLARIRAERETAEAKKKPKKRGRKSSKQ